MYRFGYGYYSAINPREVGVLDSKDWRNVVGSGPFTLERYIQGNSQIYAKNQQYWGTENLGNQQWPIPFIDKLTYLSFLQFTPIISLYLASMP